jgi:hypothetical protein
MAIDSRGPRNRVANPASERRKTKAAVQNTSTLPIRMNQDLLNSMSSNRAVHETCEKAVGFTARLACPSGTVWLRLADSANFRDNNGLSQPLRKHKERN